MYSRSSSEDSQHEFPGWCGGVDGLLLAQEQNTIRQEVLMESLGVDEVYIDRMSGKNTNRPELQRMMEYVRYGDTVIVESISRFARNTHDLLELVERLTAKGVEFVSKKEAIDTTTPTGKFMLTIFGAVAELEREYVVVSMASFLLTNSTLLAVNCSTSSNRSLVFRAKRLMLSTMTVSPRRTYSIGGQGMSICPSFALHDYFFDRLLLGNKSKP